MNWLLLFIGVHKLSTAHSDGSVRTVEPRFIYFALCDAACGRVLMFEFSNVMRAAGVAGLI